MFGSKYPHMEGFLLIRSSETGDVKRWDGDESWVRLGISESRSSFDC